VDFYEESIPMNYDADVARRIGIIYVCICLMVVIVFAKTHEREEPIADPLCGENVAEAVMRLDPC
jgi:hypothetical protein